EKDPLKVFSAVCSAVRLVFWLLSSVIGRDAICCARVMTWAKSLEYVLLPLKTGLVELLIRNSSPDPLMKTPGRSLGFDPASALTGRFSSLRHPLLLRSEPRP